MYNIMSRIAPESLTHGVGAVGDAGSGHRTEAAPGGGAAGAAQRALPDGVRLVRPAVSAVHRARGPARRAPQPRRRLPAHLGRQLPGELPADGCTVPCSSTVCIPAPVSSCVRRANRRPPHLHCCLFSMLRGHVALQLSPRVHVVDWPLDTKRHDPGSSLSHQSSVTSVENGISLACPGVMCNLSVVCCSRTCLVSPGVQLAMPTACTMPPCSHMRESGETAGAIRRQMTWAVFTR